MNRYRATVLNRSNRVYISIQIETNMYTTNALGDVIGGFLLHKKLYRPVPVIIHISVKSKQNSHTKLSLSRSKY